ncbi:MAG: leucine-rich repeat protein, partial [Bacteroidaceae bacterium]|nr:leucine-rich repeat protein [Bacteroidaceae bacterium]
MNSVSIPKSVESIGDYAFYNCSELLDVYCYAENVPSTAYYAFDSWLIEDATL